jgi:two-component system, NtrC family, sensor kinase
MTLFKKGTLKTKPARSILKRYVKFRHSIYGRVVFVITILSIILFLSFGIIFRSVTEQNMRTVIDQTGNNIGYLVEGALYHAMLENDKRSLENTLDIINNMAGIDEVNMYDADNNLVYSSFSSDNSGHSDPNCSGCHANIATMFPLKEKSSRIIEAKSECQMNHGNNTTRHLLIHSPILNRKSCYESSCHAHKATDQVLGSFIIKMPLGNLDEAVQKSTANFFLLATLTTGLLVIFLILFTRKKIQSPLRAIIRASVAVADGDTSTRLEIRPNQLDDMRMVSLALNHMLDNLQAANSELQNWSQQLEYKVQKKSEELGAAQNELIHIERIASLGKLSLSVAHEINNPLSGILVYTKLVSKQVNNQTIEPTKKENILKNLKLIENETKRCGDIVRGLLDFSKSDQKDFEAVHLHEVLRKTSELMSHPMKIANINFISDFSAGPDLIFCSPNQIKQACIAILVNAKEAVAENGEIIFRTYNPDESHVRIEISDNGVGISPDDIPHVFEPFFSTKQNASGIGLGLAIVHGIIQSHKGKIELKSQPGAGTTFSITFPLVKDKEA